MDAEVFIKIVDEVADGLSALEITLHCPDTRRRRIGEDLFDRQCMIDPYEPDCVWKAVDWMSAQGPHLILSYLEIPNHCDVFSTTITKKTRIPSARGITVFDVLHGKVIGRIDILFKVASLAPPDPPRSA